MERIDRPVFVVGVDHSGTSILYRMLARHPEFAWLSQYSLRDGTIPSRMRIPFGSWINRVGRRWTSFTWKKNERFQLLRPQPREGVGTWTRLIPRVDGFFDASDCTEEMADRVRTAVATELRAWRRERMLVKIPYLTRSVLLLDHILPDARFIHITRDGKAVALSNRERLAEEGRDAEDALLKGARLWVDTLRYLERCEEALGERIHTVRYEALCEDVRGAVFDALRFCGLDPDAARIPDVPSTLDPTNDKWFRRCSERDRLLLDRVLGPTLERWGYRPFRRSERASR